MFTYRSVFLSKLSKIKSAVSSPVWLKTEGHISISFSTMYPKSKGESSFNFYPSFVFSLKETSDLSSSYGILICETFLSYLVNPFSIFNIFYFQELWWICGVNSFEPFSWMISLISQPSCKSTKLKGIYCLRMIINFAIVPNELNIIQYLLYINIFLFIALSLNCSQVHWIFDDYTIVKEIKCWI